VGNKTGKKKGGKRTATLGFKLVFRFRTLEKIWSGGGISIESNHKKEYVKKRREGKNQKPSIRSRKEKGRSVRKKRGGEVFQKGHVAQSGCKRGKEKVLLQTAKKLV